MHPPYRSLFHGCLFVVFLSVVVAASSGILTTLGAGSAPASKAAREQQDRWSGHTVLFPSLPVRAGQNETVPLTAATPAAQASSPLDALAANLDELASLVIPEKFKPSNYSESLYRFVEQLENGQPQELRGVFVEDVLALPVVQQLNNDVLFVSEVLGTVTQFGSAARHGITGLLAHNYLSGDLFFQLELDQEVNLVYGDGTVRRYLITDIQRYQKLPGSLQESDYVSLVTGQVVSTLDLFNQMYTGSEKVTFQTCIRKSSDWSWGRIFIVAEPIPLTVERGSLPE
jgi:hypothetical protein